MSTFDQRLDAIAREQDDVVCRPQIFAIGGSDEMIEHRLARGTCQPLHAGVYLLGSAPPTWVQQLRAGVYASGPLARVSHRAALLLWGLDGIASAPVEVQVPFGNLPIPEGVIVHRRRRLEPSVLVRGIPTTGVEQTLLEVGAVCTDVVVEKAYASARRLGLTSSTKVEQYLKDHAARGRRGVTRLRNAHELYRDGRPPGSSGEVVFLRELRRQGIAEAVRQFTIDLPDGSKRTVDFAWPDLRKAVEFVGWWVHSDARAQDDDTWREDEIRAAGWDLRRVAPWSLRHRPVELAASIARFLCRDLRPTDGLPDTKR